MLIARFRGDVEALTARLRQGSLTDLESQGCCAKRGLTHHSATGDEFLYIIGVWESEGHIRRRWSSDDFEQTLTSVGFPPPEQAEMTILQLHAIEPPL